MKLTNVTKINQTLNTELLFGTKINEKELNEIIMDENFPCLYYIVYINKMLNINTNSEKLNTYKQIFYHYRKMFIKININEKNLFDKNNTIFSPMSCINLIERILKYGKFLNNKVEKMIWLLLLRYYF